MTINTLRLHRFCTWRARSIAVTLERRVRTADAALCSVGRRRSITREPRRPARPQMRLFHISPVGA